MQKRKSLYTVCFIISVLFLITTSCQQKASPELKITKLDPEKAARAADSIKNEITAQVADGFELNLWASGKLTEDPVALFMDNQGRAYITNTNRRKDVEFDIRGHKDWMIPSISFQTVEDHKNFIHKELAPENSEKNTNIIADFNNDGSHDWKDLTVKKEEVRRIEDKSGDGVADFSQLYVSNFNTEISDIAGAVLKYQGDVFVGVAPDMWRLKDTNNDGMADEKTSISHGYQVHIGFGGHNMSGLTVGPAGRVYWSIGDIGSNITAPDGKQWKNPNRGAIFRSNPDGSDFEVFSYGLRNTHEFSFDKHGNLITSDNDGDHAGERERLVYLFSGSDSGWRINWQFGKYIDPKNNQYKVWMDEDYHIPRHEGQTAHIVPPIQNFHNGPAGMAYNPGTALSEQWKDYFFLAEFVGSPTNSAVHAFKLKQDGTSFALADEQKILSGIAATGMDFGPDGALYVADWIGGWELKDKGRVWRLDVESDANRAIREETRELLGEDFSERNEEDLNQLLHHPDKRIRKKAQFELADRGAKDVFLAAANQKEYHLARIHGLWGIWQLALKNKEEGEALVAFLNDEEPEIRSQTAKILGDIAYEPASEKLIELLEDPAPRPRFFAAQALGQIGYEPAVQPILDLLERNDDEDAYLRYAASLALARIGNADPLVALHDNQSDALRRAAVIALKKMEHPGAAEFLDDENEYIATDAARAINDDAFIRDALPDLAESLNTTSYQNEPFIRRAINANVFVGGQESAERLAEYASKSARSEILRTEAINALGVWHDPSTLDRVTGRYRGEIQRDTIIARQALQPVLETLLTNAPMEVRKATVNAVGNLRYREAYQRVFNRLKNDPSGEVKIAALVSLQKGGYKNIKTAIQTGLDDPDKSVRMKALTMVPELDVPVNQKVDLLASVLESGSVTERQSAFEALGNIQDEAAYEVLNQQMDRLMAGELDQAVQLDLLMAIENSESDNLKARMEEYQAAKPEGDQVAAYREALFGGDAQQGRRIFYQNDAAQCVRCHVIEGEGGEVGPDLTEIGKQLSREQLLESMVDPGARIAPGFGTVTLTLEGGSTVSGVIQEETEEQIVLLTSEGGRHEIAKENISERSNAPSSMPPMGNLLDKTEIRHLVEFMSTLK